MYISGNTYTFGSGVGKLSAEYSLYGVRLPDAVREGYILEGWYDAKTGGNIVGTAGAAIASNFLTGGDIKLYARWTKFEVSPKQVPLSVSLLPVSE